MACKPHDCCWNLLEAGAPLPKIPKQRSCGTGCSCCRAGKATRGTGCTATVMAASAARRGSSPSTLRAHVRTPGLADHVDSAVGIDLGHRHDSGPPRLLSTLSSLSSLLRKILTDAAKSHRALCVPQVRLTSTRARPLTSPPRPPWTTAAGGLSRAIAGCAARSVWMPTAGPSRLRGSGSAPSPYAATTPSISLHAGETIPLQSFAALGSRACQACCCPQLLPSLSASCLPARETAV